MVKTVRSRSGRKVILYDEKIPTDFAHRYQRELIESYDRERGDTMFTVIAKTALIATIVLVLFAFVRDAF